MEKMVQIYSRKIAAAEVNGGRDEGDVCVVGCVRGDGEIGRMTRAVGVLWESEMGKVSKLVSERAGAGRIGLVWDGAV
jgi:hypothetical protein